MVLYGESPYRYGAYWGTISNHIKKQIHHIETILLRPCNSKNRHVVAIFEPIPYQWQDLFILHKLGLIANVTHHVLTTS